MPLVPPIKENDWPSVKRAVQGLSKKLDHASSPVFAGLSITSLTLVNTVTEFSTDGTLGGNSDSAVPTEKAVKTYADAVAAAAHTFKTITGITNNVVADSASDTLTLASANARLTIVGTTASDTITFTADTDLHNYSWTSVDGTDLKTGSVTQAYGAVLDDLNTLGIVGADSEFLIGTAEGALAWESGATARNSIGLGAANTPIFARQTLTDTCLIAGGANFLRVTGLQADGTAMSGILRGAYIDVSNGSTAATGTIRGMEIRARTEAPDDSGSNVAVLEGLSISANSKAHNVTTMRAAEFIIDGKTGGTITEAVGLRIANNLQANKATTSYGLQIYRDSFDYTADIQLSSGGLIGGSNGTLQITSGGNVGIGMITPSYKFSIGSTDNSDQIGIYHDNTDAYMRWDDGVLYFRTKEGDNTNTELYIQGKGTGYGKLRIYDNDDDYFNIYAHGGRSYFTVGGSTPIALSLVSGAQVPIEMFRFASEGETKELQIYGYKTGDSLRSLQIGVGVDAANTASFDGVSNYLFDGNIIISGGATIGQSAGPLLTFDDTNNYLEITGCKVGIGTTSPDAKLTIVNGVILASGTIGATPVSGAGTRLMWIPAKAAFRAGLVVNDTWDDANIGTHSISAGASTTASGSYSTAFGHLSRATGGSSTALGYNTEASGQNSLALMASSIASGENSLALGLNITAGAAKTFVLGTGADGANLLVNNIEDSFMVGFNSNIPTFFVGVSTGVGTTGKVGIGVTDPHSKLEVNGAISSETLTITASADDTDVSGVNTLFVNTTSGDVTLGGLVGGVAGQTVNVIKIAVGNDLILEHEEAVGSPTQDFKCHQDKDEILDTGGAVFVCDGTYWWDVSHAKHVS